MRKARTAALAGIFLAAATSLLSAPSDLPRYDHIVVVIEENHSRAEVMGSPYLSSLAARGILFTRSFAVAHPSQPNYIALFSGSTHGIRDNAHHDITAANLASSLAAAGLTFAGFSEDLPAVGFRGDSSGAYVRKHSPWACFTNVPDGVNRRMLDFPTTAFDGLPTVSFVVPNLRNDMHDGSVAAGDSWLRAHIDSYARWAVSHNSLLIVTFDEGPGSQPPADTPIATILVGARVRKGTSDQPVTHYSILRAIEDIYGLPHLAEDSTAAKITGTWE